MPPDFTLENSHIVCGIDEAGRGPLCGPVVAACVFIPHEARTLPFWRDVNDSKKLSAIKRDKLFKLITAHSYFGIGEASASEIDKINILQATLLAMSRAYHALQYSCHIALIDGNKAPSLPCETQTIIKGDSKSISIACASIIAKVTRDRTMAKLDQLYPAYGWVQNAGYGTQAHLDALARFGPTPHHRQSFAPLKKAG